MPTEDFSHGEREEALIRFAGDVIVELRPDGRFIYVSPAVEGILGRPASHYIGLSFLEVIIPEDRRAVLAGFRKVVETGDEPLLRFRCFHREGHLIELESSIRSFVDDEGRQRIVAVSRDRTEQSLRGTVDRTRDTYHRAIAESGIRPVAVTKKDGEILFSNRRFREIFGRVSNLAEIRERMSEDSRLAMDSAWYRANHDKGWTPGACDFEYHSSNGSTSWFSANWESIRNGGSSSSFAIHYQDITRRKKIEQALRIIASGISGTDEKSFQPILAMIAEALEMDRIVLGLLEGNDSGRLKILVGLQDGQLIEDESALHHRRGRATRVPGCPPEPGTHPVPGDRRRPAPLHSERREPG